MPIYKTLTDIGAPERVEWYSIGRDEKHAKSKALSDSVYTMCILTRVPEHYWDKQTKEDPFPFMTAEQVERFPVNGNIIPDWVLKLT